MRETRTKQLPIFNVFIRLGEIAILRPLLLPLLLLADACLLWIISLPRIDPSQMNDLGLISVLPITFYVALAVLAISFVITLNLERRHDFVLFLHVLLLIFMFHATPQIVYGTLRYSWAWKHVGIVDYIQRNGSVNPTIADLNAYHNWPGFFALAAFYNQVAGLSSSLSYAGWGPVFFNLLDLGALLIIFKSLTKDHRLIWLSVWFFFLFSWIGQDYFSPQAMSYFLFLVALAIILKWFRERKIHMWSETNPILRNRRLSSLYNTLVNRTILENSRLSWTNPQQRIFIMVTLILIFVTIASSHQLTPLMLVSALTGMVIFQVSNQRYLPILMAVVTVAWIIFMAVGFLNGNLYWIIKSIGSLLDNVHGNLINLAIASHGQQMIASIDRSLSAAVWVLGLAGFYRRYRSGHWDLTAILLAITPLPMLAANAYGGEMLFRIYLFGLPFITFLAAGLFYPELKAGKSIITSLSVTLLSLILIPGFLFSYYGKERMYYFSPNEVAAARFVFNNAPKGALIVDSTWNWPRQSTHYEDYNYLSLLLLPPDERMQTIQNPANLLARIKADAPKNPVFVDLSQSSPPANASQNSITRNSASPYPAIFIVITRSQMAEAEMTGVLSSDWFTNLEGAVSQSNSFKIVLQNSDAVVYENITASELK